MRKKGKMVTKRKKKKRAKSAKNRIKEIESALERAEQQLAKEGNTDGVEDLLDKIEHQINSMKAKGLKRLVINQLKSKLDKIK